MGPCSKCFSMGTTRLGIIIMCNTVLRCYIVVYVSETSKVTCFVLKSGYDTTNRSESFPLSSDCVPNYSEICQ